VIGPFIDPNTREKVQFNPDVRKLVPPEQLDKDNFGGDLEFKYDHGTYFKALDEMAAERREEQFRRWREIGGGKIGVSEFVIRGGNEETKEKQEVVADGPVTEAEDSGEAAGGEAFPGEVDQVGSTLDGSAVRLRDVVRDASQANGAEEDGDLDATPTTATTTSSSVATKESESSATSEETREVDKKH
jgi:hypothetical protein